jgi:hypothetical protein
VTYTDDTDWRAEITRDHMRFGLAAYVWRRVDNATELVLPTDLTVQRFDNSDAGMYRDPSLRFNDGMGVALLNALAAHFGGTSDVIRLQRDLAAERARVDKFIAHLTRERTP